MESCFLGRQTAQMVGDSYNMSHREAGKRMTAPPIRVGVVGTGFVARRLIEAIGPTDPLLRVSGVLSRRPPEASTWLDRELHTASVERLVDGADVILDLSGDPLLTTEICFVLMERGTPLITLNAEFHATNGAYFADRMFITEALGDQPGCSAALHAKALDMGFEPLAHINYKGFMNHNPALEDMRYWADLQQLSLSQTISFTDGTKLQIEQAFLANGLDLDIAREGLMGGKLESYMALEGHAAAAEALGSPIADFVLAADAPPGVALVARHDLALKSRDYSAFKRLMTPSGPYFVLVQPYHLIHFECLSTLRDFARTPRQYWRPLLVSNATPQIGVAALAKRPLRKGECIEKAAGGFEVRGIAVRYADRPDHVPICLLDGAVLRHDVEPGEMLGFDSVDMTPSRALDVHMKIRQQLAVAPAVTSTRAH